MFLVLSCSCLCPIHWSQVLSREWRCSWSSADRFSIWQRCFQWKLCSHRLKVLLQSHITMVIHGPVGHCTCTYLRLSRSYCFLMSLSSIRSERTWDCRLPTWKLASLNITVRCCYNTLQWSQLSITTLQITGNLTVCLSLFKLEQLECLCSKNIPAAPWSPIHCTIDSFISDPFHPKSKLHCTGGIITNQWI